jgi:NADH:ubiquinone oxidoreductase subunit C
MSQGSKDALPADSSSSSELSTSVKPKPTTVPATKEGTKKEVPAPPPFEKELVDKITSQYRDKVKVVYIKPLRMKILVSPQDIIEVATFLRDNLGFDHAESVAGTDYPKDNEIEVNYHLGSYTKDNLAAHIIVLATRTNRDDAQLPTLINIYRTVEYHERETFEMLGVYFNGHPRNERFLLPEDWADMPPLRKEFRIKGR